MHIYKYIEYRTYANRIYRVYIIEYTYRIRHSYNTYACSMNIAIDYAVSYIQRT